MLAENHLLYMYTAEAVVPFLTSSRSSCVPTFWTFNCRILQFSYSVQSTCEVSPSARRLQLVAHQTAASLPCWTIIFLFFPSCFRLSLIALVWCVITHHRSVINLLRSLSSFYFLSLRSQSIFPPGIHAVWTKQPRTVATVRFPTVPYRTGSPSIDHDHDY
jgi:hypothetical protein